MKSASCSALLAIGFALPALALPALSQTSIPRRQSSAADSVRVLKGARSAQARFESYRRFHAPYTYGDVTGRCEPFGRFCEYHSDIPLARVPDEPSGTRRARNQLLAKLASAALSLPGDDWIAGQRVRYLIEAGQDSLALIASSSCRGTQWWCAALRGLVFHSRQETPAAEAAFDSALALMPTTKRCSWTDLYPLLEGSSAKKYRAIPCSTRSAANARIWMLSDPLYSLPGNDRRAEHFARRTWIDIEKESVNGFSMRWGDDMAEMIVRFGRAEKWTQEPPTSLNYSSPRITSHEREPNFHFFPSVPFDTSLAALDDRSWSLDDEMRREAYAPPYAERFVSLSPQVSRFRRGDSTLVVASYDVSADTSWAGRRIRAALAFASGDSAKPRAQISDSVGTRGALMSAFSGPVTLAGVELLSKDSAVAGRWRSAIQQLPAEAGPALSDLLLFEASDSLGSDLESISQHALGTPTLPRDRKTGVYWEMYGASAGDSALAVSLTFTPISEGILRRAVRALGIGQSPAPVNIKWSEPGVASTIAARAVQLDLSRIAAGKYQLTLEIGSGSARQSSRIVDVK